MLTHAPKLLASRKPACSFFIADQAQRPNEWNTTPVPRNGTGDYYRRTIVFFEWHVWNGGAYHRWNVNLPGIP